MKAAGARLKQAMIQGVRSSISNPLCGQDAHQQRQKHTNVIADLINLGHIMAILAVKP